MPVHLYTEANGDDGQLMAVHESGGDRTVYKFTTKEDAGEKTATLTTVIGAGQDANDLPDAVREAIEARGYTVETNQTSTDGGVTDDSVVAIREALMAAKEAAPDERDEHIKTALGEVLDLQARQVAHTSDLQEQLTNVLVAPDEEGPYFINQSLQLLEYIEEEIASDHGKEPAPTQTDDVEEPPESVRWIDEDRGVLELELTRPFIEWLELEAAQHDFDSAAEWVRTHIWVALTQDLMENHGFTADVEVEVPHDYARRVSLWLADREIEGEVEQADIDAFLFNHMQFQPNWTLGGEPWDLVEDSGDDGGDEDDD